MKGADLTVSQAPTSAVVRRRIQDAILRGEFPPGSTLPEIPLSRRFETSRGTIREALRALADSGLVVLHARRGGEVAQLSPQRAREIFSLRAVLEGFAVNLALTEGRLRKPEAARIEAAFDHMKDCAKLDDPFALIEADMQLHWTICTPCGHEILLEQLRGLQVCTRQFIFYTKLFESDVESEVEAHTSLLRAVLSGEADRAKTAVRNHITSAGERLLIKISESGLEAIRSKASTSKLSNRKAAP